MFHERIDSSQVKFNSLSNYISGRTQGGGSRGGGAFQQSQQHDARNTRGGGGGSMSNGRGGSRGRGTATMMVV